MKWFDRDDEGDDNLPALHESEQESSAVESMRKRLRDLDSPMMGSTSSVQKEARDVGDVDVRANPRACDLDYVEGYECAVDRDPQSKTVIVSDPPNWALASDTIVAADSGSFIEDITDWA